MGLYNGDNNQIGFFYESGTYANGSGTLQWMGLVTNHEANVNFNRTPLRYAGNATRNVERFEDGVEDVDGNFTYHPQDWRFLMFAMGSIVDTSGAFTSHEIKEVNSTDGNQFTSGNLCPFISFGIEDFKAGPSSAPNTNFKRKFQGCQVDTFEISWDETGFVENTVNYVGQRLPLESGAKSALTEDTGKIYVSAQMSVELSGSTFDTMKTGTFSIANNLVPKHYNNGSKTIALSVPENRDYTFNPTLDMDSTLAREYYEKFYEGGSEFNGVLKGIITSGSREVQITMSGCSIIEMPVPMPVEGVNEYSMTIQPKSCSAVAIDNIGSYAPF
jgi:hypothetical protein